MRPEVEYKYNLDDYVSVKHTIYKYASNALYHSAEKGRVGRITEQSASFYGTRYYRINLGGDKESVWIAEHELDNIDPLSDWEKALLDTDCDKVSADENKFKVADKVTHSNRGKDVGIVIEVKENNLYQVAWKDGTQQNHASYMRLVLPEQIKADDPRLEEFWKRAQTAAAHAGFCSEFDRIADSLGRPKPKRVTTTVRIVQPVTIEIEVEHDEGEKPDWKTAWSRTSSPQLVVAKAAKSGRFQRWQAALEKEPEGF